MTNVNAESADRIIEIFKREALRLDKALSLAVVDAGGYIVSVHRMDHARPLTSSIAVSKAHSAAVMQRPTHMLKAWSTSDPTFFAQLSNLSLYPIVATMGGMTLKRDGEIIGGIGISGGSPDEDQEVCDVILSELGFDSEFSAWAGAK